MSEVNLTFNNEDELLEFARKYVEEKKAVSSNSLFKGVRLTWEDVKKINRKHSFTGDEWTG